VTRGVSSYSADTALLRQSTMTRHASARRNTGPQMPSAKAPTAKVSEHYLTLSRRLSRRMRGSAHADQHAW
jgi:hypothetical protein